MKLDRLSPKWCVLILFLSVVRSGSGGKFSDSNFRMEVVLER